MAALRTLVTEADYLAIEEVDGGPRYELDEGELVEMPNASAIHNEINALAAMACLLYFERNPIGRVFTETDVRLSTDTIRRPDLMIYLNETIVGVDLLRVPLPVAPEFVMEIVSPSESSRDVDRRLRQYERAGVRMIVMVYPLDRYAAAYLDGRRIDIEESEFIEIPFLPGLQLPLAKLLKNVPAGR